jgi:tetratricopeptide (TPR) repeat protein
VRRGVLTAWLLGAALAAAVPARAAAAEDLFLRGNAAYETGRFEEAAQAYTDALRTGVRDSRLEYNLANALFKLGRLGEAILHYERATRLAPIDSEIRTNLGIARSHARDRVETETPATLIRLVSAAQDRVGPDRQAVGVLILLWSAAGFAAWRSARPGGWNPASGWVIALLAMLFAVATLSWWPTLARLESGRPAVILAPAVQVLAGPGENNAALFTVHEGLTVEIRTEREPWVQVSLPNGLHGWVPRAALEPV